MKHRQSNILFPQSTTLCSESDTLFFESNTLFSVNKNARKEGYGRYFTYAHYRNQAACLISTFLNGYI